MAFIGAVGFCWGSYCFVHRSLVLFFSSSSSISLFRFYLFWYMRVIFFLAISNFIIWVGGVETLSFVGEVFAGLGFVDL